MVALAGTLTVAVAGAPLSAVSAAAGLIPLGWLAARRGSTRGLGLATAAAGAIFLAVTVADAASGISARHRGWAAAAEFAGVAGLLIAVAATARASGRAAAAGIALAGAAVATWAFRGGTIGSWGTAAGVAVWSMAAVCAAGTGWYLRLLEQRRLLSVARARQEQRLKIAHDLHDYVAHDVSGMLALSQAGRLIAGKDPQRAAELFTRIEEAAQQALGSMDRSVGLLSEDDDPGLADLPRLVERFAAAGQAATDFTMDPAVADAISRQAGRTLYRVAAEALTNVRRHALGVTAVRVSVELVAGRARLIVTDDGAGEGGSESGGRESGGRAGRESAGRENGGRGLTGLTERVRADGGTLTAGSASPSGWQVTALVPSGEPERP